MWIFFWDDETIPKLILMYILRGMLLLVGILCSNKLYQNKAQSVEGLYSYIKKCLYKDQI